MLKDRTEEKMSEHLTLDNRYEIFIGLRDKMSLCKIAQQLNKHPSTITNEILKHYVTVKTGSYGRVFNDCLFKKTCKNRNDRRTATPCYDVCSQYKKETCKDLMTAPYVCDGCTNKNQCSLEKRFYKPTEAQQSYEEQLKESRRGFSYSKDHIAYIDKLVSPLIKQGQSIHHIYVHHKDELMMCEKTLYTMIHSGLIEARPIDCPRIVRFKPRKVFKQMKVDRECRTGRTYEDFLAFLEEKPDSSLVEMDTVEGVKGGKVLLTLYHPQTCLLLAFLRDHNDSASVTGHMNALRELLGAEDYCKLFELLLCDNGSEFTNPAAIETVHYSDQNESPLVSLVFYCDGGRPDQKGGVENSHTLLRRILPKGTSFDHLTQKDIDWILSHINSYARKKLNDYSPIDTFSFLFSSQTIEKFNLIKIDPDKINLTPNCLK